MVHRPVISRRRRHRSAASTQNASNPLHAMPEIPGMWYDETLNRYFRITQEHPRPPTKAYSKPPYRQPSLFSLVRNAELDCNQVEPANLPARLIAKAVPKHVVLPRTLPPIDSEANTTGALAVLHAPSQVGLYSFPEGRCVDGVDFEGYEILNVAWCEKRAVLLVSAKTMGGGWHGNRYTSLVCSFGDREEHAPPLILIEALQEVPYSVGLEGLEKAVGCETSTYYRCMQRVKRTLKHPDGSAGLATALDGHGGVFTGTRIGNVYRWDRRAGERPVWNGKAGRNCSVADLKVGDEGRMIYVSRMKSCRGNLAAWDLRMGGGGCVLEYGGHVNLYKRLKFDIMEEWGVLCAGGDDNMIRVWDLKRGGRCLGERRMEGMVNEVKLVGEKGGWISTNQGVYAMDVDAMCRKRVT